MSQNFNYLFQYLEKESISIDKSEFLFQIQSHPDFPSLLAISDTLSFFNIKNSAIRVGFEDMNLLPKNFISLLAEIENTPHLNFIQKKEVTFLCLNDKKTTEITKLQIEKRWLDIVLIVEKQEENNNSIHKKEVSLVLPMICLVVYFILLFSFKATIILKCFIIFPLIGLLFSIATLKDLFGVKSELISSFCNISVSTSCDTIINSDKWKLFKFLNFSSLSIVFYSSQFFGLFLFMLTNSAYDFFVFQKVMLICSLPIIGLSIYFQKMVEKKWCPICLVIISILLFELGYILLLIKVDFVFTLSSLLLFVFLFSTISLVWLLVKKTLLKQKELKEFQMKSNRFMRNYSVFKNCLLTTNKIDLADSPIILGNKASDTEITIITSPFCGFCSDADEVLNKILNSYGEHLKVKVYFNIEMTTLSDDLKLFYRSFYTIYLEKDQNEFRKAMRYWYETKDLKKWLSIYSTKSNSLKIDEVFFKQNEWCKINAINFTPAIFVNGYHYPKAFEKEQLEYFIADLLDDATF